MKQLPSDLALRLKDIYSPKEMDTLQTVFALPKRPVSFRVNTLSSTPEEIEIALGKASITYTKLEFPENCYLLDDSFLESDIWRLKIYKHGKIYMQGISSQIPVASFTSHTSLNSQLRILDACAAPGGKTSQIASLYPNAEIIALDPFKVRYEKLCYNLKKQGIKVNIHEKNISEEELIVEIAPGEEIQSEVTCIQTETRYLDKYITEEGYFDMILIDAPCSSEGSLSLHNEKFIDAWDISHINKNYKRQKHIIDDLVPYLKQGGELIYSTCNLAPEENEGVIHYILCNYPELELQKIDLKENKYTQQSPALKKFGKHIYKTEISEKCIRVTPSEYSEGFFIAKFIKKETVI